VSFADSIEEALAELERDGLFRTERRVESSQGTEIILHGRPVLCFCSNNYLGLAGHPALQAAVRKALPHDGVGAGASRLISGSMEAHRLAESALASFCEMPEAALFSSGYAANLGTIQALLDREDVVFSDALNHASLIDGCRLSRAQLHVYRHRDVDHLAALLQRHRPSGRRALIVSDSLFSMDGVSAPLRELRLLADRHDAGLLVDEAHALGVLGPGGRGLAAEAGIEADVLIGTLGKAFGAAGAFAAASPSVVTLIRNRARSYVFSTAPSPALSAAVARATELVREASQARASLRKHSTYLRKELASLGYAVPSTGFHILPILVGDNRRTMDLCARLLEHGVFVQGIRPPTVPPGTARLRLTPMATHSRAQVERAIEVFRRVAG
jgi:8-amino-7-oxononanoate synthase